MLVDWVGFILNRGEVGGMNDVGGRWMASGWGGWMDGWVEGDLLVCVRRRLGRRAWFGCLRPLRPLLLLILL